MNIRPSQRLSHLSNYPYAEIDRTVSRLKAEGIQPIDFGVGDPLLPPPPHVQEVVEKGIRKHETEGYPPYEGASFFRENL